MNSNKKTLTAILILLVMCTGISISYAFFKVASSNNNANTNVTINGAALCMSLQLSSDNITISNEYAVPISDSKALSSDTYKTSVTITNNCNTSQSFNLLLVPNSSNTMPIKALKYALVEEGATPTTGTLISNEYILDNTIQKQLLAIKNETLKNGFSVGSGTVSSGTKTYNLYLWIDKDEGSLGNGSTMNKSLNAYLTLGSGSVIGDLKLDLYHTIENRYNQDKTYIGLYTGEGANTYANKVYYYKGNVQNNNVLFGGFCWKIVRTTETGGVKIVYNGVQKDENFENINENNYKLISNDEKYPYTFDSTSKTWVSTNKTNSATGTLTFTVDTAGDYYLSYVMSSEAGYDKAKFYKNGTALGDSSGYSGTQSGTIALTGLTTSDVIKVEYSKDGSGANGSDTVTFSIGKAVGDPVKSCNNTGTDSQIGTSKFNSSYNSPAYVGYMYNIVYPYSSKTIINSTSFSGTKAYGDGATYASNKYTLTNAETLSVSSSNISTLVGKYTCNSSSTTGTCSSLWYIVGYSGTTIYYYSLSGGTTDGTTLANKDYVFGSSFTYANGTYTLSDTVTLNSDTFITNKNNVNTHHYTCLSNGTTCSSIYYVYYISGGTPYYITLTGGKSVSDALNEMLYADDVNKNDSTIKTYIDNWYESKIKGKYEDKLEDTVFCNDRGILNLNGWNPNGGDTTQYLQFKNYSTSNQSLVCANETDRFSMSNSKAKLKHPIGLLSVPELSLAGYGSSHYFNNGQYVWLASPFYFYINIASVRGVYASGWGFDSVINSGGVRPSVSLKPNTYFSSGDGSFTKPFVIGDAVEEPSGNSFDTVFAVNNTDIFPENGIRYEGADPNNYICLDNKTEGTCSDSSLLFRIIGLFDEDTSTDGTTSSGTKKLLKVIDINNYGGTDGKYWNSAGTNNWSTASLKTELNETYLSTLLGTSNVNSKLSSAIANAKWHLGGANANSESGDSYYYKSITTENVYKAERPPYHTFTNLSENIFQNLYSGNPSSIYAKVGLMYPSDYGYATVGGTTTNKSSCRSKELYNWDGSSYSDCKNNDWLFTSQVTSWGSNKSEWLLSPYSSVSSNATYLYSAGYVSLNGSLVSSNLFAVRPTFYLDSSVLKIVGTGDGTKDNAYRIG